MGNIHLLPAHIANQIAAGEVIERPASIVKELIENSLDAGARHITVRYQNGGKTFLLVEDDGLGMNAEDALLAFQRHATSKLSHIQDLQQLQSFGFRGEALPSIASVAKVLLKTKTEMDPYGTELLWDHGKCLYSKACSHVKGSCMLVTELFANVPVRRRFLKSDTVEAWHIQQVLLAFALLQQKVYFEAFNGDRCSLHSPLQNSWTQRCADLFDPKFAEELLDVDHNAEGVHIQGALLKAGTKHFHPKTFWIFVNQRWITSRFLQSIISEAYDDLLPIACNPVAFLSLTLDASLVDINVHPQKREVRFRNERSLRQTLKMILEHYLPRKALPFWGISSKTGHLKAPDISQDPSVISCAMALNNATVLEAAAFDHSLKSTVKALDDGVPVKFSPSPPDLKAKPFVFGLVTGYFQQSLLETENSSLPSPEKGDDPILQSWRFIGTLSSTYAIFEGERGLLVLHYRGAKERICYEEILRISGVSYGMQELLIPILLPALEEKELAEQKLQLLQKYSWKGYLDPEGQCVIQAIPSWLHSDAASVCAQRLWSSEEGYSSAEMPQYIACECYPHVSLSESRQSEIEATLAALFSCRDPLMTPNGRMTYYEIPFRDIERHF